MNDLLIEQRGRARWLILNRPEKRNALTRDLIGALHEAVTAAADDAETRCLVLAGAGKLFCAGADLNEFVQAEDPAVLAADGQRLARLLLAINRSPKPVIVRVQGAALAGGAGLAAAADFVIAAEDARFALTEVRIGLVPAVISPFVLRAMGRRAAQAHMLTGAPFDAAEALRTGLAHRVVPADELDTAVDELVAALSGAAPGAMAAVKELLDKVDGRDPEQARDITTATLASRRASEEGQEGMRAFLEKRTPRWAAGS